MNNNPRNHNAPQLDLNLPIKSIINLIRGNKLSREQLNIIIENPRIKKDYNVRIALVLNQKAPLHSVIGFINDLYTHDLANVCRKLNLHPAIRELAENYLTKRLESMRIGDKIALAKITTGDVLQTLLKDKDTRVFTAALGNYRLREVQLIRIASNKRIDNEKLSKIIHHNKWANNQSILKELAMNTSVGYASHRRVFERLHLPFLVKMTHSPLLRENHKILAHFVLKTRLKALSINEQMLFATSHSKNILNELVKVVDNRSVLEKLFANPRIKENDIIKYIESERSDLIKEIITGYDRWKDNKKVKQILNFTKNTHFDSCAD